MPEPYPVKPDREFLHRILDEGGEDLKKCYQCATCSVVCELSDGKKPFPRKEMIWAQWGLKDRLVVDPDIWLCYQCNDCSTHCPRGARPGDVMAAIRREAVAEHAVPGFLGRWLNQPKFLPLLLGFPAVILGLLVLAPLENGPSRKIVYSCWNELPHRVLIGFFGLFTVLALLAVIVGVARFWRAIKAADARDGVAKPAKDLGPSIVAALRSVFTHDKFTMCIAERSRLLSHMCVFYGFLALSVVAVWVVAVIVTARFNPLIPDGVVYPFSFWNPWRMLANLGGVAVVAGCGLMIWERLRKGQQVGTGSYSDWAFVGTLLAVVLTGLLAEGLHYARLEPHRLVAYFAHLVFVFALLMHLPYCKFAHLIYRTTAMVYAEHSGRSSPTPAAPAVNQPESAKQEDDPAPESPAPENN